MRLRLMANACRCRVLALGAAVSCLYFFILELIVSRHLDLMNSEPQPQKYLDNSRKSVSVDTKKTAPVTMVTRNGRMLGRRLSQQRVMVLCTNMTFQIPPGPVTALASFPGSGNTWIRYLLQQATGLHTGSIYTDYALLRHGFPAENVVNGSVLLVKTHEWGINIRQNYSRAVLLVRDPLSAILAEFNRQGGGHIGHASMDKYMTKDGKLWKAFVSGKSRSWLETNLDWLKFAGPLHVIRYENFTTNVEYELRELLNFFRISVPERTMKCVLANREGIYKRKKKSMNFDPFNKEMKSAIERYQQLFETALKLYLNGFRKQMIDFIDSMLPTL